MRANYDQRSQRSSRDEAEYQGFLGQSGSIQKLDVCNSSFLQQVALVSSILDSCRAIAVRIIALSTIVSAISPVESRSFCKLDEL